MLAGKWGAGFSKPKTPRKMQGNMTHMFARRIGSRARTPKSASRSPCAPCQSHTISRHMWPGTSTGGGIPVQRQGQNGRKTEQDSGLENAPYRQGKAAVSPRPGALGSPDTPLGQPRRGPGCATPVRRTAATYCGGRPSSRHRRPATRLPG